MQNEMVHLRMKEALVKEIDGFVKNGHYKSRTEFLNEAARNQLSGEKKRQLVDSLRKKLGEGKRLGLRDPEKKELEKIKEEIWRELHKS